MSDRECPFVFESNIPHVSFRLFLAAQRTTSLRHDIDTQASLINRLLRSYVHYGLYDQADKLVSKTTFPACPGNPRFTRLPSRALTPLKIYQLSERASEPRGIANF